MKFKPILLSTEFRPKEVYYKSRKDQNWLNVTVCVKSVSGGQCVVIKYKKILKKYYIQHLKY